jgi:myo-inositol-1(or 4)-monophosphatase
VRGDLLIVAQVDRAFFQQLSAVARAAIRAETATGLVGENKAASGYDPVTAADRAAERAMRELIERSFPDHGIWGEEYGLTRGDAPVRWSLDPVDGTRALLCGLPSWAVLVGLLEQGQHVAGMIDLPAIDETLIGLGGETRRNGEPVRASGCTALADARFSTTDPFLFSAEEGARVERVRRGARLVRFGLDAMGYARVATGDLDLVVESGLKPHDYDALVAVVRGAGGYIGDWEGGTTFNGGRVIAAATRELYDEALAMFA